MMQNKANAVVPQVVVRNTFIHTVDESEDVPPSRTVSDQTGLHPNRVLQLSRHPQTICEDRERSSASSTTDEQDASAPVREASQQSQEDPDWPAVPEDAVPLPQPQFEEEDEEPLPLTRTQTAEYPAGYCCFGTGPAAAADEGSLVELEEAVNKYSKTLAGPVGAVIVNPPLQQQVFAPVVPVAGMTAPMAPVAGSYGPFPAGQGYTAAALMPCPAPATGPCAVVLPFGGTAPAPAVGAVAFTGPVGSGTVPLAVASACAAMPCAGIDAYTQPAMMTMPYTGSPQQRNTLGSSARSGDGRRGFMPLQAPVGSIHSFHMETQDMGHVTDDFRNFTKVGFEGRLSVVSEKEVHEGGVHRYLVQFSAGELSRADGVGFVFSNRLPCAKNIQRIVSIFVNQQGRICMRIYADVIRASACMRPLELGDWVELTMDLDEQVATFHIWPQGPDGWPAPGRPASTAVFPYGQRLGKMHEANHRHVKLNVGHLACVVKNVGVTVTMGS